MNGAEYRAAWTAIAAMVSGIERSATIYAGYLIHSSQKQMPGADDVIYESCVQAWRSMRAFRARFSELMPVAAREAIDRFQARSGAEADGGLAGGDFTAQRVLQIRLIALSAEVTYLLDDMSESIRTTTDVAFMHLQRLIVADDDYRRRWIEAFRKGETSCERMGGAHLLWHGILAFKTDATGGRSDLVFPGSLRDRDLASARGLVLTEWKKASGDGAREFETARRQTDHYAAGILGAVELSTYRYLVVVTEKGIREVPADKVVGGVTFRHVNVAVDPDMPSVAAARAVRAPCAPGVS